MKKEINGKYIYLLLCIVCTLLSFFILGNNQSTGLGGGKNRGGRKATSAIRSTINLLLSLSKSNFHPTSSILVRVLEDGGEKAERQSENSCEISKQIFTNWFLLFCRIRRSSSVAFFVVSLVCRPT
jgi:hypothetical protein